MKDEHDYRRLPRLPSPPERQSADEVEEEVRFHLDSRVADLQARGHSREEAMEIAEREFGDLERARATLRGLAAGSERRARRLELMRESAQDVRYGFRKLRRSPALAVVAGLTLALGIGAITAIFGVVEAVVLRPLPYPDADRIITIWENHERRGGPPREWTTPPTARALAEERAFVAVGTYQGWGPTLLTDDEPIALQGSSVTQPMLAVLGVEPVLGRWFLPEEDVPGAEPVVVLSHGVWQRVFGGNAALVGGTVNLAGVPHRVVGVLPPGFRFPGASGDEIFRPLLAAISDGCGTGCYTVRTIARMAPGLTVESARERVDAVLAQQREAQQAEYLTDVRSEVVGLQETLIGPVRPAMLTFLAAVGVLLLIACANVANLLLARASTRQGEMAVRTALGASRWRIARQLLTESTVLAVVGGLAGAAIGWGGVEVLRGILPPQTPRLDEIGVNGTLLAFALGATAITALLSGLLPALHAARGSLAGTLRRQGRGEGGSAGIASRRALVVVEMALTLVLLVGAGLLIRSFAQLRSVDPGFQVEGVLAGSVSTPPSRYPETSHILAFHDELLLRLERLPGVRSVGGITTLPLGGSATDLSAKIEGQPPAAPGREPSFWYQQVTPDYLSTLGVRLLRGRGIEPVDRDGSLPVGLINETAARLYWPNEDPLGSRIIGGDQAITVVGVVEDVRHFGLELPPRPSLYLAHYQFPARQLFIALRTDGDPRELAADFRREVAALDPMTPVTGLQTMGDLVAGNLAVPRFVMTLLAVFAGVGLSLAAVGLYGVVSYGVAQRTREIGVRMALGAAPGTLRRMVLSEGLLLTGAGTLAGLAAAFVLTRVMGSLLYETPATDAVAFGGVATLLVGVGLIAAWVPARRATRVDPVEALRFD